MVKLPHAMVSNRVPKPRDYWDPTISPPRRRQPAAFTIYTEPPEDLSTQLSDLSTQLYEGLIKGPNTQLSDEDLSKGLGTQFSDEDLSDALSIQFSNEDLSDTLSNQLSDEDLSDTLSTQLSDGLGISLQLAQSAGH